MKKDLNYYLNLKYPTELREDEEGGFVVSNTDLPGCVSFGDTPQEALDSLKDVRRLWIEGRLQAGETVPEPIDVEEYSGKFVLRIPRWLHQSLDLQAKRQSVSLNAYVSSLLAERSAVSLIEHALKAVYMGYSKQLNHLDPLPHQEPWRWASKPEKSGEGFWSLEFLQHPKKTTTLKLGNPAKGPHCVSL